MPPVNRRDFRCAELKFENLRCSRPPNAEAHLSMYGARMALFVRLPRQFDFDPGDGHPLALRLICLNSVDGSSPFRIPRGPFGN